MPGRIIGKAGRLGDHRESETLAEVHLDERDGPTELHAGSAGLGKQALFVGMGQPAGDELEQIEQIPLAILGQHAVLSEQPAQGA